MARRKTYKHAKKGSGQHVRLDHWLLESDAWQSPRICSEAGSPIKKPRARRHAVYEAGKVWQRPPASLLSRAMWCCINKGRSNADF